MAGMYDETEDQRGRSARRFFMGERGAKGGEKNRFANAAENKKQSQFDYRPSKPSAKDGIVFGPFPIERAPKNKAALKRELASRKRQAQKAEARKPGETESEYKKRVAQSRYGNPNE